MNKKKEQNAASSLTPLLALGLAACGGGGGGSPPSATPRPNGGNGNGNGNGNGGLIDRMPPLPDDISVALYENHPTNKAVYDLTPQGQALDDAVLTPDVADNGLFELRDGGQIWW